MFQSRQYLNKEISLLITTTVNKEKTFFDTLFHNNVKEILVRVTIFVFPKPGFVIAKVLLLSKSVAVDFSLGQRFKRVEPIFHVMISQNRLRTYCNPHI